MYSEKTNPGLVVFKGKPIADEMAMELKVDVETFFHKSHHRPKLVVLGFYTPEQGDMPKDAKMYANSIMNWGNKVGVQVEIVYYNIGSYPEEHLSCVQKYLKYYSGSSNIDDENGIRFTSKCDGILVLQPLPRTVDIDELKFNPILDVDGMTKKGRRFYTPATAMAVGEILARIFDNGNFQKDVYDFNKYCYSWNFLAGNIITVIGRSETTGIPICDLIRSFDATIINCHSKTPKDKMISFIKNSDIVISTASKANIAEILPDCQAKVIVDIGMDEVNHNMVPSLQLTHYCPMENVYYVPPIGGVGSITCIYLLQNVYRNAKLHEKYDGGDEIDV